MINLFKRYFYELARAGNSPGDSGQVKNYKYALVFLAVLMSGGGMIAGIGWAFLELGSMSLLSFGYVLVTVINLFVFSKTKNLSLARIIQLFISLLLPFLFQWMLGGLEYSGGIMVWGIMTVVGVLTCTPAEKTDYWFYLFLVFTVISGLIDRQLVPLLPPGAERILFVINISVVALLLFVISRHYVRNEQFYKMQLFGQIKAINSTLAMAEFDAEGKVLQANDLFRQLMKYDYDRLTGLTHDDLLNKEYCLLNEDRDFWKKLVEGKPQSGEFKRYSGDREAVWWNATYTPVTNADGHTERIIVLATDITAEKVKNLDYQSRIDAFYHWNPVIEFNPDGFITTANDLFLQLMGYSLDELKGRHHSIFIPEGEADSEDYKKFWKKLQRGQSVEGEFKRIKKTGEEIWIAGSYNIVYDTEGNLSRVVKFARDISRRKYLEFETQEQLELIRTTEEELRQNLEEMQTMQDQMEAQSRELSFFIDAINMSTIRIEFGKNARIVYVNENFCESTSYTKTEVVGQPLSFVATRELVRPEQLKELWQLLDRGETVVKEVKLFAKDERELWVRTYYIPIRDDFGNIFKISCICTDVTEEKLQKQQNEDLLMRLWEKDVVLQTLLHNAPLIFAKLDNEGVFELSHGRALRSLGLRPNEVTGQSVYELYKDSPDVLQDVRKALKGTPVQARHRLGEVYFQDYYVPNFNQHGEQIGMIILAFDITEQVRAEEFQQRLISIIEAMPVLVGMSHDKMQNSYMNRGGKMMLGYPPDFDNSGVSIASLHPEESDRLLREVAHPYATQHGLWRGETRWFHRDGSEIITNQIVIAHKNPDGGVRYMSTVALDITEIKRAEIALRQAKELAEEQNLHIMDSIRYAQRIQQATLVQPETIIKEFAEAFILLKAKDIVSGDFYWFAELDHLKIIAAADCTGHGVPGAFMTVMGNDFLNEIVFNHHVTSPDQILYMLDRKLSNTLQKHGSDAQANDGMDITILATDGQQVYFAGAKNPMFYVRTDENGTRQVHEVKGSKFPIGGGSQFKTAKTFDLHTMFIEPGDVYYLFSDGYQDQFGGANNSKYMKKRFREFLFSISDLPMEQQKARLHREFTEWKGQEPQTDDVLVMGLKF